MASWYTAPTLHNYNYNGGQMRARVSVKLPKTPFNF